MDNKMKDHFYFYFYESAMNWAIRNARNEGDSVFTVNMYEGIQMYQKDFLNAKPIKVFSPSD